MFQRALRNVERTHRFTSHNLHCRHLSHSCFHFLSFFFTPTLFFVMEWKVVDRKYGRATPIPWFHLIWQTERGGRLTDHSSPAFFLCGNHYKPVYFSDLRSASQPYAVYMHSSNTTHTHHSVCASFCLIMNSVTARACAGHQ